MDVPFPAIPRRSAGRSASAWLDGLQMLSGAVLILFMWTHLLLVSSVVVSPAAMNAIARFFEDTGLIWLAAPGIFLVFLVHFALTARKIPWRTDEQVQIWGHSRRMRHADTWLWVIQAASAMAILIMGSIHMAVVVSSLPITAARSAERVQGGWLAFYLLLLPLVELHVGIGFYRIAVKWGIVGRAARGPFKRKETVLTGLMIAIGLATLLRLLLLAA